MRAANAGDDGAYKRLLSVLAPVLRAGARRGLARSGVSDNDSEDLVQETLLAIHLKRHTWDPARPIGPWIRAIARNKLIDYLRRRGGRTDLPIEDFEEILPAATESRASRDERRRVLHRRATRAPARCRAMHPA